jgi:hypothetical protein
MARSGGAGGLSLRADRSVERVCRSWLSASVDIFALGRLGLPIHEYPLAASVALGQSSEASPQH